MYASLIFSFDYYQGYRSLCSLDNIEIQTYNWKVFKFISDFLILILRFSILGLNFPVYCKTSVAVLNQFLFIFSATNIRNAKALRFLFFFTIFLFYEHCFSQVNKILFSFDDTATKPSNASASRNKSKQHNFLSHK